MTHRFDRTAAQPTSVFHSAFPRSLRSLLFNSIATKWIGTEGNKGNEVCRWQKNAWPLMFALMLAISSSEVIAGPRVDIVIGEKAPALERLAADELANQLKRVYEADVKIGSSASVDTPYVIFVGSPDTNASMKPFADFWPSGDKKLSGQGHLLRSVTHNKKPALLIGGGSPVATYWAVAEFGHRLGIRSMLFGDLDPVAPPGFTLERHDVVIEPSPRHRGWKFRNSFYTDSGCWSSDEFRSAFRQLAKLRFNQVTISIEEWQPYTHFEFGGIERSSSQAVGRKVPIAVAGDTLGRKVFGGAKVFEHPNFSNAQTYAERRAAAEKHLHSVIDAAQEVGLSVTLHVPLGSFPVEFAALWPETAKKLPAGSNTVHKSLGDLAKDSKLAGLTKASVRAVLETYPTIDGLHIDRPLVDDVETTRAFLAQPGLLKRPDGRQLAVTMFDVTDDSDEVQVTRLIPDMNSSKPSLGFVLDLTLLNTLPCFRPQRWEKQWDEMARLGNGFEVVISGIGENDLPAYWLSRRSCGHSLSSQEACRELLTPVCGEEIDHRVWKGVEFAQSAIMALMERDSGLGIPKVQAIMEKTDPAPPTWNTARDGFLNAMNEMYRANTRAREGGRAYTLYLARRFEFAYEYMNYAEAVRKSAIAERANDRDAQIAEIEKAIEALNNALNAMAAVARSNSDRGLIAVLNEYGYRPLKKKLAEAEDAVK